MAFRSVSRKQTVNESPNRSQKRSLHRCILTLTLSATLLLSTGGLTYGVRYGEAAEALATLSVHELLGRGEAFQSVKAYKTSVKVDTISDKVRVLTENRFGVNEMGKVMILMYHRIGDDTGYYTRSADAFRSDLERLYAEGYYSVSMASYVSGKMEVPLGKTPVIFTFDDGHVSNFKYIEDDGGNRVIDSDCAVGILDAFYEAHPDFGRHAIFYLNEDNPFGQPKLLTQKLDYLKAQGYEIGNHTLHHLTFKAMDAEAIQEAIGGNVNYFTSIDKGAVMTSLAIPFGERPSDQVLWSYLFEGVQDGMYYHNDLALLVGWRPEKPLYAQALAEPFLNRVQCGDGEYQLSWWLDYFQAHPEERYISDGDAETITLLEKDLTAYTGDVNRVKIRKIFQMGGSE